MTLEQAQELAQAKMKEVKAKSLEKTYGDNKKAGEEFMANIAKKAGIKPQLVKRDEQNVKKLDAERIDAFITDELVGRALIKKIFPGKEDQFDTVEKPDSAAALYVIVRKGNAAGETMVASLNAGLLKLKESGELDQIVAKYVR